MIDVPPRTAPARTATTHGQPQQSRQPGPERSARRPRDQHGRQHDHARRPLVEQQGRPGGGHGTDQHLTLAADIDQSGPGRHDDGESAEREGGGLDEDLLQRRRIGERRRPHAGQNGQRVRALQHEDGAEDDERAGDRGRPARERVEMRPARRGRGFGRRGCVDDGRAHTAPSSMSRPTD